MRVSPFTSLYFVYARPSPRHASPWSCRRATGAQRLFPATASAEGAQLNGSPFPASATAEGAQLTVPPSSAGTLVRVLEPPVKAGISQMTCQKTACRRLFLSHHQGANTGKRDLGASDDDASGSARASAKYA